MRLAHADVLPHPDVRRVRAPSWPARPALSGWVHRRRDHGHLIFLDLRDRHGITQVVARPGHGPGGPRGRQRGAARVRRHGPAACWRAADRQGEPAACRPVTIELRATWSRSWPRRKTPPFYINEPDATMDEALRLSYRYLDLRREPMQRRLLLRSRLVEAIRDVHTPPASWRSRRRSSSSRRPRAPATSSCPRASSRAASTPCRRARSSSSSCSWSPAWTATSRSPAASATRTCAATASPSSASSTWR